jgi:serine/threonine protein phosphatase PrpC
MGHLLSHPVCSKLLRRVGSSSYRCGAAEMQGYRINMEDAHSIQLKLNDKHPNLSYFAVFDGHSGQEASLFCSRLLHERIGELQNPEDSNQLQLAVERADAEFMRNQEVRTHGSTACFALVRYSPEEPQYSITIANVGDSRAILIGKDGKIKFSTIDHKPDDENEAQRIRSAGGSVQFGRVDGELAMSRSIGDWNYKQSAHLESHQQKVIARPDISKLTAEPGQKLLICCDGLLERLTNEQLVEFTLNELKSHPTDPALVMSELLDHSLKAGSKDNMSAMLIDFTVGSDYNSNDKEFIPGPYTVAAGNQKFVEAYKTDAKRHGIEDKMLMKLVQEHEAKQKEKKK